MDQRTGPIIAPNRTPRAGFMGLDVKLWPATLKNGFWSLGSERKITDSAAAYTAVHLSLNRTSIVFSAIYRAEDR
jgi:hypothetical protein